MSATYITIQLRRASRDGEDPGLVDEAWFTVKENVVLLVDRDGNPLQGDLTRHLIGPKETAREVAVRMLRARSWKRPTRRFSV
jgi:hypothetical protein